MSYNNDSNVKNEILGSLIFDTKILEIKEESVVIQLNILYHFGSTVEYNDQKDIIIVNPNIENIIEELNNYFSSDEVESALDNGSHHYFEGASMLSSGRIKLLWC